LDRYSNILNTENATMKRVWVVAAFAAGLSSVAAAADVGVSIQFSQPGAFGRIDIGQFPQPQVIVAQPVLVAPPPGPPPEAVYLWVPMEHRLHWDRYCGQYHACGHPVYFVNHVWYRDHVMAHRERAEDRREDRGHEHGHEGHDRDERGHDDHGHGHGHD
jgi:hypothetical protein